MDAREDMVVVGEQSSDSRVAAAPAPMATPDSGITSALEWATCELKCKTEALERSQRTRQAIQNLSSDLLMLTSVEALADRLLGGLSALVGADHGSVMLADEARERLTIVAGVGLPAGVRGKQVMVADSVSGSVISLGQALLLRGKVRIQDQSRRHVTCSLLVPITSAGKAVGVVNLNRNGDKEPFGDADLEVASTVVATFSAMFAAVRRQEETRRVMLATIKALTLTIEAKDPYTRGHCERVRMHARAVGEAMGLDPELVDQIDVGATLHDIGKIGVPESVLIKPGPLSEDEYDMVKQHPRMGVEIVSTAGLPAATVDAVQNHHERFDGTGYPRQLKGEEIPLAARILAVADAFDAMTISRPYRQALTVEAAIGELSRHAGTQFDPMVVDVFLKYCEREELSRKLTSIETARKSSTAAARAEAQPQPLLRSVGSK